MAQERIFKVKGSDVWSARDPGQLNAPHAILGVVLDEVGWERVLSRAYDLGRADMRADIRKMLEIR